MIVRRHIWTKYYKRVSYIEYKVYKTTEELFADLDGDSSRTKSTTKSNST